MKKLFLLMTTIVCVAFAGCSKEEVDDFKFGKENIYGKWVCIAVKADNNGWTDITKRPSLQFSATFNSDGTYYGSGFFGNGSGTWKAKGNTIYTYIDGEEFYHYKVFSISGNIAEMTMGMSGASETIDIRCQKQ